MAKRFKIIYKDESGKKTEINEMILTTLMADTDGKGHFMVKDKGKKIGCFRKNARGNWEFFTDC